MKRHVPCFVEKAWFELRTLGTKGSTMTTALYALCLNLTHPFLCPFLYLTFIPFTATLASLHSPLPYPIFPAFHRGT